ncbi:uncharacterized protein LOC127094527 [Lathyrus oleraceus]|uniref:uncharacterized protein LOC127094527 n=1 Tax=Pisum sativum TaxID=3888 RepID=UPI001FC4FE1D|nr:uncharacterized protein LOC127094527 [Pisum sativum]
MEYNIEKIVGEKSTEEPVADVPMVDIFLEDILNGKDVDCEDSSDDKPIVRKDNVVEEVANLGNDNPRDAIEKSVEINFDDKNGSEKINVEEDLLEQEAETELEDLVGKEVQEDVVDETQEPYLENKDVSENQSDMLETKSLYQKEDELVTPENHVENDVDDNVSNNVKENVGNSVNVNEDPINENFEAYIDEAPVDHIDNDVVNKKSLKRTKTKVDKKGTDLNPKKILLPRKRMQPKRNIF